MASDHRPPAPSVVLVDANLLYPFHLRNLLIQFGVERLIDLRWTAEIHEEWIGNLVASGRATRERLTRTLEIMSRVLPKADVRGYKHRITSLVLPDAGDRHVLAAAIEAGASILLTYNLTDFPSASLAPYGVTACHPDDFLCELHAAHPEAVEAAVNLARENLTVTAPTMGEFVEALERQRLVRFAARIVR